MTDLQSQPAQQQPEALHPSLLSFLHSWPVNVPLQEILEDSSAQPPADPALDMHFLLVAPPSPFATTILETLQRIKPGSQITHTEQLPEAEDGSTREPCLALIDVDAPDGEAQIRGLSAKADVAIVALSAATDAEAIDRALHAGAAGYLPKTYSTQLIEAVLRLVIGGERYRPHNEAPEARKRGRPLKTAEVSVSPVEVLSGLTPRQKDVLLELARGASNLDISRRLNMKEGTVKTHLFTIYRKLGVTNRAKAALFGMRMSEIQQEQMIQAQSGKLDLSWLQPEMSHRRMRAGQWIFHQGDVGSELFYVQRGQVSFPEIGDTIGAGEVFGEIGIFVPGHKRTSSARCETDVDLFTLSSGQVRRIYFGNPQFALFIMTLVATRLADGRTAIAQRAAELMKKG